MKFSFVVKSFNKHEGDDSNKQSTKIFYSSIFLFIFSGKKNHIRLNDCQTTIIIGEKKNLENIEEQLMSDCFDDGIVFEK